MNYTIRVRQEKSGFWRWQVFNDNGVRASGLRSLKWVAVREAKRSKKYAIRHDNFKSEWETIDE